MVRNTLSSTYLISICGDVLVRVQSLVDEMRLGIHTLKMTTKPVKMAFSRRLSTLVRVAYLAMRFICPLLMNILEHAISIALEHLSIFCPLAWIYNQVLIRYNNLIWTQLTC